MIAWTILKILIWWVCIGLFFAIALVIFALTCTEEGRPKR